MCCTHYCIQSTYLPKPQPYWELRHDVDVVWKRPTNAVTNKRRTMDVGNGRRVMKMAMKAFRRLAYGAKGKSRIGCGHAGNELAFSRQT